MTANLQGPNNCLRGAPIKRCGEMYLTTAEQDAANMCGIVLCLAQLAIIMLAMRSSKFRAAVTMLVVLECVMITQGINGVDYELRVSHAVTLAARLVVPGQHQSCTTLYSANVLELDVVRWHTMQLMQRQDQLRPSFKLDYDRTRNELCLTDMRSLSDPGVNGTAGVTGACAQ